MNQYIPGDADRWWKLYLYINTMGFNYRSRFIHFVDGTKFYVLVVGILGWVWRWCMHIIKLRDQEDRTGPFCLSSISETLKVFWRWKTCVSANQCTIFTDLEGFCGSKSCDMIRGKTSPRSPTDTNSEIVQSESSLP